MTTNRDEALRRYKPGGSMKPILRRTLAILITITSPVWALPVMGALLFWQAVLVFERDFFGGGK